MAASEIEGEIWMKERARMMWKHLWRTDDVRGHIGRDDLVRQSGGVAAAEHIVVQTLVGKE